MYRGLLPYTVYSASQSLSKVGLTPAQEYDQSSWLEFVLPMLVLGPLNVLVVRS